MMITSKPIKNVLDEISKGDLNKEEESRELHVEVVNLS